MSPIKKTSPCPGRLKSASIGTRPVPSPGGTVDVTAGSDIVCTITNKRKATMKVVKQVVNPAGAVDFYAQLFTKRRSGDSGGPESNVAGDPFLADFDPSRLHRRDHALGEHFDSQFLQVPLGAPGRLFRKRSQDARGTFIKSDTRFSGINDFEIFSQHQPR